MNTSRNKDKWDSLSMKEKSDMMKAAVQQGIYNLSEIRKAYNEYAEGGPENQPYTSFLNETPMQAAIRQLQSPEAQAAYWNATHPQTTNETPIIAQPDGTFRRETRNIPLNTAGEAARTALEFTPVVGDVLYAGDVADEARQGNYGTAATMAGLAAIPFVGNRVGKAAGKFIKKFRGKDVNPQSKLNFKVNWDANNWFKTISGRDSYTAEEAAELASHIPEYRNIEQRLFEEGKLTIDFKGNVKVVDSKMTPQEYIMRQSKAFQKMNPDHHYTGVRKELRNDFENSYRDPVFGKKYEVWTDRKSPENVEEYAYSGFDGNTINSRIKKLQEDLAARHQKELEQEIKEAEDLHKKGILNEEDLYDWIKFKKEKYEKSVLDTKQELKMLLEQRETDPLNGGKVFDVTYPKEAVETPIIDAENKHWTEIPFNSVKRDAPSIVSHYTRVPYNNTLDTDKVVQAARRHGYDVTHINNVMDTGNGTMLNETIIGYNTPVKSVLGNTGSFDLTNPNKWLLYRGLMPFAVGTAAASYANQQSFGGPLVQLANKYEEGGPTEEDKVLDLSDRGYKSKKDLQQVGNPPMALAGAAAKAVEYMLQGPARFHVARQGARYIEPAVKYVEKHVGKKAAQFIKDGYESLARPFVNYGRYYDNPQDVLINATMKESKDTVKDMLFPQKQEEEYAYGGPLVNRANQYALGGNMYGWGDFLKGSYNSIKDTASNVVDKAGDAYLKR